MGKLSRILHVDDDDDIRQIAKLTLELVGHYEVAQCASGPEAIAMAQDWAPQLFLLDVMMPDMSGEETMRRLTALSGLENVPTIFMTAKAEQTYSKSLLQLGALAVIVKPFDPTTLCDEIETAWRSRS
jgi:CheY-like chemotaxis protein